MKMIDVVPELLNKIKDDFYEQYRSSKVISSLNELIYSGKGNYNDAHKYSLEVGRILSNSLTNNLSSSVLPDGMMYFNIAERILGETLTNNHELVSGICEIVQNTINQSFGLGLKAIKPKLNKDAIRGIVERVSSEIEFDKVIWILGEPIETFSEKIVDESVKINAEFQSKSGLSPKIIRIAESGCCDWCNEIAGEYTYPGEVPDDVYRRHANCRCTTEYVSISKRQNVWTKR